MKKNVTGREIQRVDFVESLYKNLKKQTRQAEAMQERWIKMASIYIDDGMTEEECAELLIIDGLNREAARGYAEMAVSNLNGECGEFEYSFQFEDIDGRVWSSSDLGKIVKASSDQEAWTKAEDVIFSDIYECEPERLVSVDKIDE